jgi:ribosome recycling factor
MYHHLEDYQSILDHFADRLKSLHTGRVNSSVLDHITVEAYGSKMRLIEVGTITLPEPGSIMITPFDKGNLKPISDAISKSNLGVHPQDDGIGVRLNFPAPTEESRKARCKEVDVLLEDSKIHVRQSRIKIKELWEKQKKDGDISEDQLSRGEEELQEEVNGLNRKLDELADNKKKELMAM